LLDEMNDPDRRAGRSRWLNAAAMALVLSSCNYGGPLTPHNAPSRSHLSERADDLDNAISYTVSNSQDLQDHWLKATRGTIPSDFREHWRDYENDVTHRSGGRFQEYLDHLGWLNGMSQSKYIPDEWVMWNNPPMRGTEAEYFKDSYEEFRKQHGDGGWLPRCVMAQIKSGERKQAERFLNSHHFDWRYNVAWVSSPRWRHIAEVDIRVVRYPSEQALINFLEGTGLFLYVSRVDAGAGPMPSIDGAQALLPIEGISNGPLTSNSTGVAMESHLKAIFGGWKAHVKIEPIQQRGEFYYTMKVVGAGKLLATRSERFWEIDEVAMFLNRPAVEKDTKGRLIMTLVVNCSYAKGPPDHMPPVGRFKKENDDEFIDKLDLQRRLVTALVSRLGGEVVINP
jgi:hypothetical protein